MLAKDNKKLMPRIRPSQEPTTDEVLRNVVLIIVLDNLKNCF